MSTDGGTSQSPPGTLVDMVSGLALAAPAWVSSLQRRADARTGVRVLATETFDVWLLAWPVGTSVSPHHHGESDAAFALVSGTLCETRWEDGRPVDRLLRPGDAVSVNRGVVHDVGAGAADAVSVHVYSPPLSRMTFFDERGEEVLLEEPVDPQRHVVAGDRVPSHKTLTGIDGLVARARRRISPRARPEDLAPAIGNGAIVVDTRPAELRQREGALEGAIVLERNVLEWRLDPWGTHRIPPAADPERPVIVVCDEGFASSLAAESLLDLGRRNVTDLEGGFQAWRRFVEETGPPREARTVDPAGGIPTKGASDGAPILSARLRFVLVAGVGRRVV